MVHGFYSRDGGNSRSPWRGLNLSEKVGDDADAVRSNWHRLADSLGDIRVARMTQVHGVSVHAVGVDDCRDAMTVVGKCDGLLTSEAGLGLTVLTADCVPILMIAPAHGAIMALHAGWRGTVAGIAAAGIATAQHRLGIAATDWQAALGPAVGGCCYEVESGIGESLEKLWGAMPDAWQPAAAGHGQLDLRRANARILSQQGVPVASIYSVGGCTACAADRYFSHRQSGGRTGRQVSMIGFRTISALSPPRQTGRLAHD